MSFKRFVIGSYFIFKCIIVVAMVIGVVVCTIHFNNYHLLWWLILPGIICTQKLSISDTRTKFDD